MAVGYVPVEERCVPTQAGLGETLKEEPTKQRYLELTQLAVKACQELEAHGLRKSEYCLLGRIMEQICRLP